MSSTPPPSSPEPDDPVGAPIPDQTQPRQVGGGRRAIGDVAPTLAALTDDVLFDDVWNRPELAARDRSLITVAALVAGSDADQLRFH
ncbi:carboxymuconolactone decarboxylase family protein, partial [Klebsiella pneumoniae]|uniref:carboxymuconolactone decarboxylase family protein n=1 Tax=Klebsiella pneumoniae TaxID=573 RepID=UPI001156C2D4